MLSAEVRFWMDKIHFKQFLNYLKNGTPLDPPKEKGWFSTPNFEPLEGRKKPKAEGATALTWSTGCSSSTLRRQRCRSRSRSLRSRWLWPISMAKERGFDRRVESEAEKTSSWTRFPVGGPGGLSPWREGSPAEGEWRKAKKKKKKKKKTLDPSAGERHFSARFL